MRLRVASMGILVSANRRLTEALSLRDLAASQNGRRPESGRHITSGGCPSSLPGRRRATEAILRRDFQDVGVEPVPMTSVPEPRRGTLWFRAHDSLCRFFPLVFALPITPRYSLRWWYTVPDRNQKKSDHATDPSLTYPCAHVNAENQIIWRVGATFECGHPCRAAAWQRNSI